MPVNISGNYNNNNNSISIGTPSGSYQVKGDGQSPQQGQQPVIELKSGDAIRGEIVSRDGNDVQLRIARDIVINARMDRDISAGAGDVVSFEIRAGGDGNVSLRPLYQNLSQESPVYKALSQAGIPVDGKSAAMVEAMMREGMNIDSDSLQSMYAQVSSTPSANVDSLVQLSRLGIEATPDNIKQFEAYRNFAHKLEDGFAQIAKEIPSAVDELFSSEGPGAARDLMGKLLDTFSFRSDSFEPNITSMKGEFVPDLSMGSGDGGAVNAGNSAIAGDQSVAGSSGTITQTVIIDSDVADALQQGSTQPAGSDWQAATQGADTALGMSNVPGDGVSSQDSPQTDGVNSQGGAPVFGTESGQGTADTESVSIEQQSAGSMAGIDGQQSDGSGQSVNGAVNGTAGSAGADTTASGNASVGQAGSSTGQNPQNISGVSEGANTQGASGGQGTETPKSPANGQNMSNVSDQSNGPGSADGTDTQESTGTQNITGSHNTDGTSASAGTPGSASAAAGLNGDSTAGIKGNAENSITAQGRTDISEQSPERVVLKGDNAINDRLSQDSPLNLSPRDSQQLAELLKAAGGSEALAQRIANGRATTDQVYEAVRELSHREGGQEHTSALKELFSSRGFQSILKERMSSQWNIRDAAQVEKQEIKDLYQRIERQTRELAKAISEAVRPDSALSKSVSNIRENLDFMNQLNQMTAYVQLPMKWSGMDAHGDLYVYTNKKNLASKEGQISAFLHLDMEHLGPVDCYVTLERDRVSTNFTVEDDATLDLLDANMDILTKRLEEKGYITTTKLSLKGDEEDDSAGAMSPALRGERNIGLISFQAFDARA